MKEKTWKTKDHVEVHSGTKNYRTVLVNGENLAKDRPVEVLCGCPTSQRA